MKCKSETLSFVLLHVETALYSAALYWVGWYWGVLYLVGWFWPLSISTYFLPQALTL